ncbi:hypothetical protein GF339_17895 [candidate division KSB3 bacterium]|uniref:Uncharacterized protein n=1 Tax=candidate division KSB3 bacterium TaxID=2044937 RepID=A0A9D5Q820_9BACT|nr:hypothetical protein [candidate division KSB3 bacterium]MBD3326461.1 hypothetical protein [candidate division KSB3 bacterium]
MDVEEVHDLQFTPTRKKYVGINAELYARISAQTKQLHTIEDHLIQQ